MKQLLDDLDWQSLRASLPSLALTVLLSASVVLMVLKFSGATQTGAGSVRVAVFDVVKFANAQRAVASQFLGKNEDASEAGTLLLSLSSKTTDTITKVAGAGTLVLVKQGVVSGQQVDITDDVLTALGLPTNVPTADPVKYISEVAPTMLAMPRRPAGPVERTEPAPTSKVLP
jgi:hypothetical protein